MSLVQNHRVDGGQEIANRVIAEREIRHEKMVIDDDDVGGLRFAARLVHEALAEAWTLGTQTVVARRSDQRPDCGVFRHARQLRAVTGGCGRGKAHDRAQVHDIFAGRQQPSVSARAMRCRHT